MYLEAKAESWPVPNTMFTWQASIPNTFKMYSRSNHGLSCTLSEIACVVDEDPCPSTSLNDVQPHLNLAPHLDELQCHLQPQQPVLLPQPVYSSCSSSSPSSQALSTSSGVSPSTSSHHPPTSPNRRSTTPRHPFVFHHHPACPGSRNRSPCRRNPGAAISSQTRL